jgi:HTH-type transcriptional regulator/antitoxin HipB
VTSVKFQGDVDSAEDLGRFLQQGRLLAGMSQRELASKLGVSQRYVWEMESGKSSVFLDRLFSFLRETDVRLIAELTDERTAG